MPEIPVYAYYAPTYTEYKPFDLASLYQKYASLKATQAKPMELPKFKELEGVGLTNENNYTSQLISGLDSEISYLSQLPGASSNPLLLQKINQRQLATATMLNENKNNKTNWDKNTNMLATQRGNNTYYFKDDHFLAEKRVVDPETKKEYTEIIKVRPDQLVDEKTNEPLYDKILTFGDLAVKLENDPRFIRKPELIQDLQLGMDLSHINEKFVQGILKNAGFTEEGIKNKTGGQISGSVIASEISGGKLSKNNYEQLSSALDAAFTDIMNSAAKNSMMAYGYSKPAKEVVEVKDAKGNVTGVKYEDKYTVDAEGKKTLKRTTTDEEAALNIKLYLAQQSKPFNTLTFTQESAKMYDMLAVPEFRRKSVETESKLTQTVSPAVSELFVFNPEDNATAELGNDGISSIKIKTKGKEVKLAKENLIPNLASKVKFTMGDVDKATLEDGTSLNTTVVVKEGIHDQGGWDENRTTKASNVTFITGKSVKSVVMPVDRDGKRIIFKNLPENIKKEYRKRIAGLDNKTTDPNKLNKLAQEKGKILESLIVTYTTNEKGEKVIAPNSYAKPQVMLVAQALVHKNTYWNKAGATGVKYLGHNIIKGKTADADDVNGFIMSVGGGDREAGLNALNKDADIDDYGYVDVYMPLSNQYALHAATGSKDQSWTPTSFKIKAGDINDKVIGTNR